MRSRAARDSQVSSSRGPYATTMRSVVGVALLGLVVFSAGASGQGPRPWPSEAKDPAVTPVVGPGWLTSLGVTLSQTSLGRGPGRYGPPERTATPSPSLGVPAQVTLTGADLYRFNCQACHGLEGRGAPPEIKSAVDPVRGVPLDVLRAQMKAQHEPPGEAEARARPERVRAAILARVHNGGQRMPSREHLSEGELDRSLPIWASWLARRRPVRPSTKRSVGRGWASTWSRARATSAMTPWGHVQAVPRWVCRKKSPRSSRCWYRSRLPNLSPRPAAARPCS